LSTFSLQIPHTNFTNLQKRLTPCFLPGDLGSSCYVKMSSNEAWVFYSEYKNRVEESLPSQLGNTINKIEGKGLVIELVSTGRLLQQMLIPEPENTLPSFSVFIPLFTTSFLKFNGVHHEVLQEALKLIKTEAISTGKMSYFSKKARIFVRDKPIHLLELTEQPLLLVLNYLLNQTSALSKSSGSSLLRVLKTDWASILFLLGWKYASRNLKLLKKQIAELSCISVQVKSQTTNGFLETTQSLIFKVDIYRPKGQKMERNKDYIEITFSAEVLFILFSKKEAEIPFSCFLKLKTDCDSHHEEFQLY
jgi:hypothetical protein